MRNLFSKKADVPAGPVDFLIVGLGNPGKEYDNTRHNAGFMAVDRIAGELGVKIDRLKFKSLCGDGMLAGHRVLLMKPSTFMNLSGQAVQEAAAFIRSPWSGCWCFWTTFRWNRAMCALAQGYRRRTQRVKKYHLSHRF